MKKNTKLFLTIFSSIFLVVSVFSFSYSKAFAALSCSITSAAACTGSDVVLLRMSDASNAHVELPNQSTPSYDTNVICCGGLAGMGTSCSGTYVAFLKLYAVTDSHVEYGTLSNYSNSACISVPSGTVTIGYQDNSCSGFDTTLGSMSSSTNAHVGTTTEYTKRICGSLGTVVDQALSFSISDNSIGFGNINSSATSYATGDGVGSGTEVEAHQLIASTTATSGYTITVQGATLASGLNTIDAIGGSNTAPSTNTEQFGLRMTATGGVGTVTAPYAASGFAYAADGTTASQVASASSGDGVATTYSARYVADVAATTEAGSYTSNLIYVITANY